MDLLFAYLLNFLQIHNDEKHLLCMEDHRTEELTLHSQHTKDLHQDPGSVVVVPKEYFIITIPEPPLPNIPEWPAPPPLPV